MPVKRLWPRTDRWLLYANLIVYGSTIALIAGFYREVDWAAKTVDAYLRSGQYQTTADRLLVREAMRHRRRHAADVEGMIALLQRAVEVDPYSNANLYLAAAYHERGEDDRALALYDRYRSIDPSAVQVYLAMAELLEERGETAATERLLTEGIRRFRIQLESYEPHFDPSVANAFNSKAWAVHQRLAEGLEVLQKARERIGE